MLFLFEQMHLYSTKGDDSVPWARVRSSSGRKTDLDFDGRVCLVMV